MGKADSQQLPIVQQQPRGSSRTFLCQRCAVGVSRLFSFKCAVVLMLSVAAFVSAFFWVLPLRYKQPGFDAKSSIKLSATVQSYFQLHKPVSELMPYISRLEYDINEELGVPSLKVAVLSMHKADLSNRNSLSNWTDVVFGFLPDPINSTTNAVALSLLKSSLIDLFLQQYNLTLTPTIFGKPFSFEILRFPDGVTIVPERTPLLSLPLVNFTLNSSIYDIKENLPELKEQLKVGLHLMPNEMVYIQVTNKHGSTKEPPVMVEALVASDTPIQPERLRQLAQIITGSPPMENLGLDHSVFGKVKEISLSSFLNHSLCPPAPTPTPTPSPSPSPERAYHPGPFMAPSYSPALPPNSRHALPPCPICHAYEPSRSTQKAPHHSLSPNSGSPTPLAAQGCRSCHSDDSPSPSRTPRPDQISPNLAPCPTRKSPVGVSTPQTSPANSPLAGVQHGYQSPDSRSGKGLVSPLHVSSSNTYSSLVAYSWNVGCLNGAVTFLLLLWMS